MYQGSNKTALASQTQIADALIHLMKENPYAQISICQICREADVSRQTFYSLFDSKEQVILYELDRNYCLKLDSSCCQHLTSLTLKDIARVYSRYIHDNGPILRLLVDNNIMDCMTDSLNSVFADCSQLLPDLEPVQRTYAAHFLASGLTSIAECYVRTNETTDTAQLESLIYSLFRGSYLV